MLREQRTPSNRSPSPRFSPASGGGKAAWLNGVSITITLPGTHAVGIFVAIVVLHLVVLHIAGFGH